MEKEKNINEPSFLIVLTVVILLFVGVLFLKFKGIISISDITNFIDLNNNKFIIIGALIFINTVVFSFIFPLFFGLRRQGTRLKILTGEIKQTRRKKIINLIFYFTFSVSIFILTNQFNDFLVLTKNINLVELCKYLTITYRVNFSLLLALFLLPVPYISKMLITKFKASELSEYPNDKDTVTLGAENESESKFKTIEANDWVKVPLSGLYGNILVFGSIGTGKTSGIVKPLIEQVIDNFKTFPTVLALDTKGNFSSFLLKLLKQKNVEKEKIWHIKLDGDVTLNPVYKKDILKKSNFIEVSELVRVASANFQGANENSAFWDTKAAALIKHSVVYCSAVYGYFTLANVYETILKAIDGESVETLARELQNVLSESSTFDVEEKFNINCSLQFFTKEYNALDDKVKTGIMSTATLFLDTFNEYNAHKVFCPSEEELVIHDFEKLVNSGNVLILDINKEGISRPASIFIKTMYQRAVLDRLKKSEVTEVPAVLVGDEMQDWVTTSSNGLSDSTFLSKGREANSIVIAATQSMNTLQDALKSKVTAKVIKQCFKTIISGQTHDEDTVELFKPFAGKVEEKRESHSVSETIQNAVSNPVLINNLQSQRGNVSESYSESTYKEDLIQGKDFSSLKKFEMIGYVFNGIETSFKKIFLKPNFLENKRVSHFNLLNFLSQSTACLCTFIFLFTSSSKASSLYPSICSVIKTVQYRSCTDFKTKNCWCKGRWPKPPRPCVRVSYYLPNTFMEVWPNAGESYFKKLPAAALQLSAAIRDLKVPYGVEGDNDSYSFHSHTLAMPLSWFFSFLTCGGQRKSKMCFDGMSEHLGTNWKTGAADKFQPRLLAWSLSPKACMIKGAAMSYRGGGERTYGADGGCSYPLDWLPKYPPSNHTACNGWGLFYPRQGVYNGVNQTTGSLMIASRMKSISSEVFRNTPSTPDEKWQMIYPKSSSCFREGQNMSMLEIPKNVSDIGRLTSGKMTGYLFGTYRKVSCCVDWAKLPYIKASFEIIKNVCKGL